MILSGGFFYHLRAYRFKERYWSDHLQGVRGFLNSWNPSAKSLILIGPSAGYSLPTEWLKRFDSVIAFEPDPMARLIFERRHGVRPNWIRKRFPFRSSNPFEIFESRPGSALLFCNILGQLEFPNLDKMSQALQRHLIDREWASYHDAMSGQKIEFDLEEAKPKRSSFHEMKKWVYVKNPKATEVVVNAHQAPELFKKWDGLQFRYWQWRLTPENTHLIEGVFQERPTQSGQDGITG
jgi:hypothetical protein